MLADEISVQILREIRDEVRATNARLDRTNERLDRTNERLERLERRSTETEIRLASELTSLAGAVQDLTGLLRSERDLRPRVERCEADIAGLKAQLEQGS